MEAFAHAPAIVAAFDDDINFLKLILSNIGSPEFAGLTVEAHTPGIAQAVGVNFRAEAFVALADERIVLGNAILQMTGLGIDVDAKDFAIKETGALAEVVGIAAQTAVADADVQVSILAEEDRAGVVVSIHHRDFHDDVLRA